MRLIFAMIGTFLGITFILQLLRGQKYNPLFENLDSEEFPLASFYVVGYAWSMSGMFPFDGKQANKIRRLLRQDILVNDFDFSTSHSHIRLFIRSSHV